VFGIIAGTAVILGAAYMLWMVQRVFFGEPSHREVHHLSDLNLREIATVLPFLILVVLMGLLPQPFLERLRPSAERFVARATVGLPGSAGSELVRMELAQRDAAGGPLQPGPPP
jgi:NADH-quinone oxidoreductase subunit M